MESAPRFLCDVMLARLARYLRAAGLDTTLAVESATDAQILHEAIDQGRWLLTADRKITEHKAAKGRVIQLPFGSLGLQAAVLSGQFDIDWLSHAFTRCLMDNTPLQPVTPEHALHVPGWTTPRSSPSPRNTPCKCRQTPDSQWKSYWPARTATGFTGADRITSG